MGAKFEINLDFLIDFKSKEKIKAEDFKESSAVFSIFDTNNDGEIDNGEIDNIFMQLMKYSPKNKEDAREQNYVIFDETEAESFIKEGKTKGGKTFADLGVTVSEVFNFLNNLINKADKNSNQSTFSEGLVKESLVEKEVELTPAQEKVAEELSNIPERKDNQFSREECVQLAQLTEENLTKAKKLFFVESREKQFSAEDIIRLVTECDGKFDIKKENYERFNEFLSLKNSANRELSGEDIIQFMSLPKDKIDSAIQLLTLTNRANNPLSIKAIINIINCDSEDLINNVMNNPDYTEFEQTRSITATWISVKDESNNITYRYIKGQQYPEEIREEKFGDGTFRRIIINKNLNIEQTMFFKNNDETNPVRIETKHISENSHIEYTEIVEQGINPGTPDVYTVDSNGNKTYLQRTIIDEQTGIQTTTKKFSDDKGNLTEFSYSAVNENEYRLDYKVTDENGKEVFIKHVELKNAGNNKYEYIKDGKAFLIEASDDKVVITDESDNKSYTLNYNDYIDNENNPDIFRQNILKIPADILIFISKNPLSLSYGSAAPENQGYCRVDTKAIDIGTITNTNTDEELNNAFITIIIHELGHYINNPNLSKDNNDLLSMKEEFHRVYKEELAEFYRNHSTEEQLILRQFNGIGFSQKSRESQVKRSSDETLAESNMITSTNSKSWTSCRSYYLQRYFPRTIALAAKLIQERL